MTAHRKVALITGSGRGIGSGVALEFASQGYEVVLHDRNDQEGVLDVADEIRKLGRGVELVTGDLTEEDVPAGIVNEAYDKMGRLDVLVNNAGITLFEPFTSMTARQFDDGFKTDFRAPYLCAQRAVQIMVRSGQRGNIINVTSVHQERVNHADSLYGAMKAALARMTESLAYELAPHGIRVNSVAPGITLTQEPTGEDVSRIRQIEEQIPLRRAGRVSDVAKTVAWLASDDASYITGITIRVDGGMNLPMMQALVDGRQVFF